MANLHNSFLEFNKIIALPPVKKDELRVSRNAIRKDIESYFLKNRENHEVKFKGQGSFAMNTTILPKDNEYDVDDGVYIFGSEKDRPTPATAHNWIVKAVENRTSQETMDKNTCVRVKYAKKYHVDLPIYYKTEEKDSENFFDNEEVPQLAHKSKGWIDSDPYEFKKWFDCEVREKPGLKRVLRYLKAWRDNKKHLNLPSGIVLTILASNNYKEKDSDDEMLLETLKEIQSSIDDTRFVFARYSCYRPTVEKNEDLLEKYSSESAKKNFLDALESFIRSGSQAIEIKSKKDACAKWQKHLGDRFPCSSLEESREDLAKAFSSPDILRHDNKSA